MAVHHFQGDKEGLPRASAYESKVSYLCCRAYPPNGLFVANFENSCSTYLVNKVRLRPPGRKGVVRWVVGEFGEARAVRIHHVDLPFALGAV
jgi:hypothetical protein